MLDCCDDFMEILMVYEAVIDGRILGYDSNSKHKSRKSEDFSY